MGLLGGGSVVMRGARWVRSRTGGLGRMWVNAGVGANADADAEADASADAVGERRDGGVVVAVMCSGGVHDGGGVGKGDGGSGNVSGGHGNDTIAHTNVERITTRHTRRTDQIPRSYRTCQNNF